MNINLKDILELLTYEQLHSYVYVPLSLGIAMEIESTGLCKVEHLESLDKSIVWYPLVCWEAELNRRDSFNKQELENHQRRLTSPVQRIDRTQGDILDLKEQLLDAAMKGELNKVESLSKQLKELKKK